MRNVINTLVAIAIALAPVSSVLAGKIHQCDESAMSAMSMDKQPASDPMANHKSCKCKHAANKQSCNDDVCKCLTSLHVFIGIDPGRINLDKLPTVYNKLVSIRDQDLFVLPLLRPPIA